MTIISQPVTETLVDENDVKVEKTTTMTVTTPGIVSRAVSALQNNPITTSVSIVAGAAAAIAARMNYRDHGSVLPRTNANTVGAAARAFSGFFAAR